MSIIDQISEQVRIDLLSWSGFSRIEYILTMYPNLRIYLAGGAIRDKILGRSGTRGDFDFFLSGHDYTSALAFLNKTGRMTIGPRGSPRWYPEGSSHRYCDVVATDRLDHGLGPCETMLDVLKQFDFTGNAIALDLRSHTIYDPVNGIDDLLEGIIRAVRFDFPLTSIASGQTLTHRASLWFRILHYAALLELKLEDNTLRWVKENKHLFSEYDSFVSAYFIPLPEAFRAVGIDKVSPAHLSSRP